MPMVYPEHIIETKLLVEELYISFVKIFIYLEPIQINYFLPVWQLGE